MKHVPFAVIAGTPLRQALRLAEKFTLKFVLRAIRFIRVSRSLLIPLAGSNASAKSTPRNSRVELKKAARLGRFFFAYSLKDSHV